MNKYVYVANWKMNMHYTMATDFCTKYREHLIDFSKNSTIVICPSFVTLKTISDQFKESAIAVGAQDCSEHISGSFTSEVSAQSLAQIGCSYGIIGHSERRNNFAESDLQVAQKAIRLMQESIYPILCIGETKQEYENSETDTVLKAQLEPVLTSIAKTFPNKKQTILIAYEPVWSIGTGLIPTNNYIENVLSCVMAYVDQYEQHISATYLYGGSVNQDNIQQLKKINLLGGFLIGGASTDFNQLSEIINRS